MLYTGSLLDLDSTDFVPNKDVAYVVSHLFTPQSSAQFTQVSSSSLPSGGPPQHCAATVSLVLRPS